MSICKNCGMELKDDSKYCGNCGSLQEEFEQIEDVDVLENKFMAAIAYLGILVLIPLLAAKNSSFARFHTNQGLNLIITSVAFGILNSVLSIVVGYISWSLLFIVKIISIGYILFGVLMIMGIVNAIKGEKKELPIIGKLKIFKI